MSENDAMDALVQTSFVVMGTLTEVAKRHGLSLTQLRVFGIIRDREPRISDLAAFLGLDKSTLSGLVDRAVARGLIERVRNDDDGRSVRIRLTPEGRELAERVHDDVRRGLAPLLQRLSPQGQARLASHLGMVLDTPDA